MRAVDLVGAIRDKKLSAREVMQAHLRQIHRLNPKVNAIVTLLPDDDLMKQAAAADEALAKGHWLGPLHGLPVGVKDLHETAGILTTFGSPLHKDYVPDFDCRVVQREKQAGAIVVGKTNVPEFGLGSQTFNRVFGPTRNPYDVDQDLWRKYRRRRRGPGLRHGSAGRWQRLWRIAPQPSQFLQRGRDAPVARDACPKSLHQLGWFTFSVPGPVARNVTDCAYFLSVLAGYDHHYSNFD